MMEENKTQLEPLNGQHYCEIATDDGKSLEEISEHVRLMSEAGFIHAVRQPANGGFVWYPSRITWEGYRYLDTVRSDAVYSKSKEISMKAFGIVTMETLKSAIPLAFRALLDLQGFKP